MTRIIVNSIYEYLEMNNSVPLEQRGCRGNSQRNKRSTFIR